MIKSIFCFILIIFFFNNNLLFINATFDAPNDWDLFRLSYDRLADASTPGLTPDGQPIEVFLVEIPGVNIKREDYDSLQWQANGFVDRMPAALAAELVDRVPTYNSVVFADSGRRISQMWSHLLQQYVIPFDVTYSEYELSQLAQNILANGTLDIETQRRLDLYDSALEDALANREECLSAREPAVCSQKAVVWRETLRRRWFSFEVVRSALESAQSTVIAAQNKDLSVTFARASEIFWQAKRVDVGAKQYGTEFYSTSFTPSDWWTWWPLDIRSYDFNVDFDNGDGSVRIETGQVSTPVNIVQSPSHGTADVTTEPGTIIYQATNNGYVGSDFISYEDTNGDIIRKSIAVSGSVLQSTGAGWVTIRIDRNSIVDTSDSEYSAFHFNNKLRAENAMKFSGVFNSTTDDQPLIPENRQAFVSAEYPEFFLEFEISKVLINRPWLNVGLLDLTPVGVRGYSQGDWSDGNPFFAQVSSYDFKLLPTSFVVARNIRMQSQAITDNRDAFEETFNSDGQASIQIGPFTTGQKQQGTNNGETQTFTSARFDDSGSEPVLQIDGPQIVGWVCTPLPEFPTGDPDTISDENHEQLRQYFLDQQTAILSRHGVVNGTSTSASISTDTTSNNTTTT